MKCMHSRMHAAALKRNSIMILNPRTECLLDGVIELPYLRTGGNLWRKCFFWKAEPPLCISILGLRCSSDDVIESPYLWTSGNPWMYCFYGKAEPPLCIQILGLRCWSVGVIELPYLHRKRKPMEVSRAASLFASLLSSVGRACAS